MKAILTLLITTLSITLVAQQNTWEFIATQPNSLQLFGDRIISTWMNERDFALSPDGREIFYTVSTPKSTFQTIMYSKELKPGQWSMPEVAPFAGNFSDLEPAFSADGNTLFFASNRPLSGDKVKDFDIWKVVRTKSGWGNPENLGAIINTPSDEFYPSITRSGNIYFTAAYKGGPGREDIYVAKWANNTFEKPIALDTAINTKFYEFNAFVDPDEQYILFTSYGRKDDAGGGDLYMSVKDVHGNWQTAKNLKDINSKQLDYCPFISPNKKILFITSERHQLPSSFTDKKATLETIKSHYDNSLNGTGNIYWIGFEQLMGSFVTH
jgi:Tol biopolymer transport system component